LFVLFVEAFVVVLFVLFVEVVSFEFELIVLLPLPPTAASPTDSSPNGGGSSNAGFGDNLISQYINAQQSSVTPTPLANNQAFNYGNTFNNAIISAFQNQV
jgi:hypothetical protein